jgi:hypothetical protein
MERIELLPDDEDCIRRILGSAISRPHGTKQIGSLHESALGALNRGGSERSRQLSARER